MLSILITHYNEPWSTCKDLFDSIAIQRGINFTDLEVIVANDGDDELPKEVFEGYPYEVKQIKHDHSGVSATRNFAFDNATGDYVMFCDCDDMFLNNCGLHLVFSAMNEGLDAIVSSFVEEQWKDDKYKIIRHDNDTTFVHGKIYRRQYLIDEDIRWDENLTIHEDGYYNLLAVSCTENKKEISTPFYLWKWNDNSTVRKNPEAYVLKTYENLMDARTALCAKLEEKGMIDSMITGVIKTVCDSFYDFNKPEYLELKNKPWRDKGEKAFKKFYERFGREYREAQILKVAEIMAFCRNRAYQNGMRVEQTSIHEWLNHITKEV